jgi:hypothetical protein
MLLGYHAWREVLKGVFVYSSNILKSNFDLMDSVPVFGTLK